MKQLKMVAFIVIFMAMIILAASVSTAQAQFCDGAFGEATYIGGVEFPNTRPDWRGVGYGYCGPGDYAKIVTRNFGQYGPLSWFPMAGVPFGGVWGRPDYQRGVYHPVLDACERPLSGRQRLERAGGIVAIGTGIGAAKGGSKGAGWGALISGGIAALNDSRYRGDREEYDACMAARSTAKIPTEPQPLPPGYSQAPTISQGTVQQQPEATPSRSSGEVEVRNPFHYDVVLKHTNGSNQTWTIRRNGSRRLPWPPEGESFEGYFRKPQNGGGWTLETVQVNAEGSRFILDPPEE